MKQFRLLDVFRSLHDLEENDNTEVQQVSQPINRVQNECECAVALVHHINKVSSENIFKGLRGSSAIHGWMEWGTSISVTNPEEEDKAKYIRRLATRRSAKAIQDQTFADVHRAVPPPAIVQ